MKRPVIAIGLDAAEPALVEAWIEAGYLPNLRRLKARGSYCRVKNLDYYRAETPWTTFLTGCKPNRTGYWAPIKFHPDSYDAELVEAYDFKDYPPFYALGDENRVAIFDMPHARLADNVNGVQILAWGAHSPQAPSASSPSSLFNEIVEKYGPHPGLHNDHASCFDLDAQNRLEEILKTGIERRVKISHDLLAREDWDLFLTVFGETHAAGHFMWHLGQKNHPLYGTLGEGVDDKMLAVFQAVDKAVAEIVEKAPEDANIMVFSAHGMDTNVMDLPSMFFLAEFLYRWNFPGKYGLAKSDMNKPVGPMITRCKKKSWLWEVWSSRHDLNPLRRFLSRRAPYRVFKKLAPLFGGQDIDDLISPFALREQKYGLFFQAASWYQPSWHKMKAFALPSFSEGYIRINLKGREAQGIVEPSEYDSVCEEITHQLHQLKDARTGTAMVDKVIRTRQSPLDNSPTLPDADLVVIWQTHQATDTVESPTIGRIGPVPHFRSGSHRAEGFLIANGPEVEAGVELPVVHALDLTPTILEMMDAPIPDYFEGKSIFRTPVSQASSVSSTK